jgi:chaperone LolA
MKSTRLDCIRTGVIFSLAFFLISVLTAALVQASAGDRILRLVRERYEALNTLSVHFEARYAVPGAEDVQMDEGRFFMARGGRFRTETEQQTIVSDGQILWMFNSMQNQVIIRSLKDGADDLVTPRKLLYEYPDHYEIQSVEQSTFGGLECDLLVLVPKRDTDPTRQLQVWVDRSEHFTRKFLLEDLADNITIFEFEAFKLNLELADDTFHFTPPEGAEVIDMR